MFTGKLSSEQPETAHQWSDRLMTKLDHANSSQVKDSYKKYIHYKDKLGAMAQEKKSRVREQTSYQV